MMLPTIYCDMDGVLVNFMGGCKLLLGKSWDEFKTPEEKKQRNKFAFESGPFFWENLPPMPDFFNIWNFIKPHNPHILTAVPRGENGNEPSETSQKFAREGKWVWNQNHTHLPRQKFHAVFREHKQNYATSVIDNHVVSNILIDDFQGNIIEWVRNRGIGILHKDAETTISKLHQLGFTGI
jgi:hypothetical protein